MIENAEPRRSSLALQGCNRERDDNNAPCREQTRFILLLYNSAIQRSFRSEMSSSHSEIPNIIDMKPFSSSVNDPRMMKLKLGDRCPI